MNRIFVISLLLGLFLMSPVVIAGATQITELCSNAVHIITYTFYNNTMGSSYVKCISDFGYPYCNMDIRKTSDNTEYRMYNLTIGSTLNFPSSSYSILIYGCTGGTSPPVEPPAGGGRYYEIVYSIASVTTPSFTCPSYCSDCELNQTTIYVSGSGYVTANPQIRRDTCSPNEACSYGAGSYHPAFNGYCFVTPSTPPAISTEDILARIGNMFAQLLCWIKSLFGGSC